LIPESAEIADIFCNDMESWVRAISTSTYIPKDLTLIGETGWPFKGKIAYMDEVSVATNIRIGSAESCSEFWNTIKNCSQNANYTINVWTAFDHPDESITTSGRSLESPQFGWWSVTSRADGDDDGFDYVERAHGIRIRHMIKL
jgi:exo-beta-1,3-glucanase (GH17 family)